MKKFLGPTCRHFHLTVQRELVEAALCSRGSHCRRRRIVHPPPSDLLYSVRLRPEPGEPQTRWHPSRLTPAAVVASSSTLQRQSHCPSFPKDSSSDKPLLQTKLERRSSTGIEPHPTPSPGRRSFNKMLRQIWNNGLWRWGLGQSLQFGGRTAASSSPIRQLLNDTLSFIAALSFGKGS